MDGTEADDDAEARNDFWSMEADFIHRHHTEPGVQPHVPKEESFPIPQKNIDVPRPSHTSLDMLQEKRITDNPGHFLCIREGFESCATTRCTTVEKSGSRVFCRISALLFTVHVLHVVEDILLNNGTTIHAGDSIVTTICKELVEVNLGENTVDVLRGRWHRLRAPLLAAFGDVDDGGEASRGHMPS